MERALRTIGKKRGKTVDGKGKRPQAVRDETVFRDPAVSGDPRIPVRFLPAHQQEGRLLIDVGKYLSFAR